MNGIQKTPPVKINGSLNIPTWVFLSLLLGGPSVGGFTDFALNDGISKDEAILLMTTAVQTHLTEGIHPEAVHLDRYRVDIKGLDDDLEDIKEDLAVIKDRLEIP